MQADLSFHAGLTVIAQRDTFVAVTKLGVSLILQGHDALASTPSLAYLIYRWFGPGVKRGQYTD